jgi:hypothetical protein
MDDLSKFRLSRVESKLMRSAAERSYQTLTSDVSRLTNDGAH